ncbi:unnamed protein product, partial [marine sediment metagenome]
INFLKHLPSMALVPIKSGQIFNEQDKNLDALSAGF